MSGSKPVNTYAKIKMPIHGQMRYFTQSPTVLRRFSLMKKNLNTAKFRMMNDDSAPKLTSVVSELMPSVGARISTTTPMKMAPTHGVFHFFETLPKMLGITLSRPMEYSRREAASCAFMMFAMPTAMMFDDEHDLHEDVTADELHAVEEGVVRMLLVPARPVGLHERGEVGLGDEHDDDDAEGDHDAAADVLLGLVRLFGQRRDDAVETEEVERGDGDAGATKCASTLPGCHSGSMTNAPVPPPPSTYLLAR